MEKSKIKAADASRQMPTSIDTQRDNEASATLSDLFAIEFTPAAVAVFSHRGRRLDTLIEVANSQAADLRATLRELIAGHPSAGQADAVNSATLKAVLAAIS
jgi:hypothetical protein